MLVARADRDRAALQHHEAPRQGRPTATTTPTTPPATGHHAPTHATATTTTSTTAPPAVSAPTAATAHTATYTVAAASYSLSIAATTGECWVDVTNTGDGLGALHDDAPVRPVPHRRGHRSGHGDRRRTRRFAATVNGAPVTLPPGNQAPFTLTFQTPGAPGSTAPRRRRPSPPTT